jgi:hypothetical protein
VLSRRSDLSLDRQDRLEATVATLLRRPAGRFALDDVQLALRGIAFLTVGQLAWKAAAVERSLPPHEVACFARSFARARGVDRLADDPFGDRGILFEILTELVVDDRLDDALDLGVAKLRLRLALRIAAAES